MSIPSHRLTEAPVLKILNAADRPLTAREIGDELGASGSQAGKVLANLRKRGLAIKFGDGNSLTWIGGDGILKAAADAFPPLIAYYKKIDPALAALLEFDERNFRDRLEGRHILGDHLLGQ